MHERRNQPLLPRRAYARRMGRRAAGAKLFASAYALFGGVVFIASAGLIVAPVAHRFLHRFHIEADSSSRSRKTKPEETR